VQEKSLKSNFLGLGGGGGVVEDGVSGLREGVLFVGAEEVWEDHVHLEKKRKKGEKRYFNKGKSERAQP